jgi:hypothetical protein
VSPHCPAALVPVNHASFAGFRLCVIPGSPAPLDRICIGGDNLLLFYSHGLARLWDMKTHEFWRSMQQSKGEELLDQGGWFEV